MLAEFAVWWLRRMREVAPGILTRDDQRPDALIIAIDGHGPDTLPTGTFLLRRNGVESRLQTLALDRPRPPSRIWPPACAWPQARCCAAS